MSQAFSPVPITLADGVLRHLSYSLGDVRRIKAKYVTKPTEVSPDATAQEKLAASAFGQILDHPAEEIMPDLIFTGLVEKEGLTEEILQNKLLTGPMIEYAQVKFTEAFFGDQQRRWLEAVHGSNEITLKEVESKLAAKAKSAEVPGPATPPMDPTTILQ